MSAEIYRYFLLSSLFIIGSCKHEMNHSNINDKSDYILKNNTPRFRSDTDSQIASTVIGDGEVNVTISEEARLIHMLQKRCQLVGKTNRPVTNHSLPVEVKLFFGLVQLEVDEEAKMLITSMWVVHLWYDDYMAWNATDFGGIKSVRMENSHFWLPDVTLINTKETADLMRNVKVWITSRGFMRWTPQMIFKPFCGIHIDDYPFDRQFCHMDFMSWAYPASMLELSLINESINLAIYQSDREETNGWKIIKQESKVMADPDDGPTIAVFKLYLERKVTFTTYILTLPCIFLAMLTLVVFWLPIDSMDRTGLAMSLFASFLVLLLILVEASPPNPSSIPKLGIYYCFNMVLVILSIFLSSLVVNINNTGKDRKQVPPWLRVITINSLGRVFCFTGEKGKVKEIANKSSPLLEEEEKGHGKYELPNKSHETNPYTPKQDEDVGTMSRKLDKLTGMIESLIQKRSKKEKEDEELRCIVAEWKLVGTCLDRLFFFVYLFCIIFSLIYLFPRPA